MRHQVRWEALAGVLALAAAALEVDLSDAAVILRNDTTGALSAFRKAASPPRSSNHAPCAPACSNAGGAARRCSFMRLAVS